MEFRKYPIILNGMTKPILPPSKITFSICDVHFMTVAGWHVFCDRWQSGNIGSMRAREVIDELYMK